MAQSEEELKSFLMRVKVKSEKAGLKLSIRKTKIMASGPITSWQIEGERVAGDGSSQDLGLRTNKNQSFLMKVKEVKKLA